MLRFTNMQFIIVTTCIVFSKPHRMHRIDAAYCSTRRTFRARQSALQKRMNRSKCRLGKGQTRVGTKKH